MADKMNVMEQVRHFLAKAEHPNTPPEEVEICLQRANRLMTKHAIDEAVLRATQTDAEKRKPVVEKWSWADNHMEFGAALRTMLAAIADHNRCRVVIGINAPYTVTIVGMKEDVDWVQMLYTNCFLTFVSKLHPSWDTTKSLEENVYKFKVAGKSWVEIYDIMVRTGFRLNPDEDLPRKSKQKGWGWTYALVGDVVWSAGFGNHEVTREDYTSKGLPCAPPPKDGGWMIRAYKKWAKIIGDENVIGTQRHDAYRRTFAEAFKDTIMTRLRRMAMDAQEQIDETGSALVLRDSWEDVLNVFYDEFPNMHPEAIKKREIELQEQSDKRRREAEEARQTLLAGMTEKQRAAFLEKEARQERARYMTDKQYDAYLRRNASDLSGHHAGRAAASTVNLNRAKQAGGSNTKGSLGS